MDNDNTIPSQLGPMNTIPSALGPMTGPPARRQPQPEGGSPMLKLLFLAVVVALVLYLAV